MRWLAILLLSTSLAAAQDGTTAKVTTSNRLTIMTTPAPKIMATISSDFSDVMIDWSAVEETAADPKADRQLKFYAALMLAIRDKTYRNKDEPKAGQVKRSTGDGDWEWVDPPKENK